MQELQIIKKLGATTSLEIKELLDKSLQAVIKQLNSLEKIGQIEILTFNTKKSRKRLYIKNELFDDIFKIA